MQKSLFGRYFSVCAGIVVLSLLFCSMLFIIFSSRYLQQDRQHLLSNNLETAAAATSSYMESQFINGNAIADIYTILGSAIDADFFFADTNGKVLVCSERENCTHTSISEDIVKQALNGSYYEEGTLRGLTKEVRTTMGRPVILQDGTAIGVVFASITSTTMGVFVKDMFTIVTLCTIIVLVVTFILIYFLTYKMVRPLRDMVDATQSFAAGDYSVRIQKGGYAEFDQLAEAFNQMATTLGNLDTMHRSFTANISHELKTPMTTIGGFVDGILDGTIPPERQSHYLSIVSEEIKRLSRLTKSMLTLARIEAGEAKINCQSFECSTVLIDILFNFEEKINQKQIDIQGLDGLEKFHVFGDKDMIHQVFYNLVENAVKFTPESGYISFSEETKDGFAHVTIRNSGEGFDNTEKSLVFQRFYKTDSSRSSDTSGAGLGLNIVKQIVSLHGGTITVDSAKGEYSQFTVALPAPTKSGKAPLPILRKEKELEAREKEEDKGADRKESAKQQPEGKARPDSETEDPS